MIETRRQIQASFGSREVGSKKAFVFTETLLDIDENGNLKSESLSSLLGETFPAHRTIHVDETDDGFVLFVARRSSQEFYRMRIWENRFKIEREEDRKSFSDAMRKRLEEAKEERPRKVLVIINPAAGWGHGVKNYRRYIEPVFKVAGVVAKLVTSKSKLDVDVIIQNENLEDYDSLLIGGGDGSVSQVLNAVVKKKNQSDLNKENPRLEDIGMKIGILPCGSGNGTGITIHFTTDWTSIAINIVLGHTLKMDLMTAHDMDDDFKFISVAHLLAGFLSMTAVGEKVERYRFLGPIRYMIYFIYIIRGLIPINVKGISVREPDGMKMDEKRSCLTEETEVGLLPCTICQTSSHGSNAGQWTPLPEKFLGAKEMAAALNVKSTPLVDIRDSRWDSLHHGEGVDMVFCETADRVLSDYLKLVAMWYPNHAQSRMAQEPNCCRRFFTEMKMELDPESLPICVNVDGEVFQKMRNLYLKVHPRCMEIYGAGEIAGHPNAEGRISKHAVRAVLIVVGIILLLVFLLILTLIVAGIAFLIKFLINL